MQAVIYIQADPQVWEACKENAETLCKGIKDGGGRIQSCLVGAWLFSEDAKRKIVSLLSKRKPD